MNLPASAFLAFSLSVVSVLAADSVPALKDPAEQKSWEAIAARFTKPPSVKTDSPKTVEYAVSGLKSDPAKGGDASASITVDKASGRVIGVTSNGAAFLDDEFAHFAAFTDLQALTLWHNSGGFTGSGIASILKLPKLDRLTLAGGGLDDTGMAQAAKITNLRELRAWHSKFSDAGIAAFRNHPNLESIKIGPSWESTLTDKTLEIISTCPHLKKFGIAETWLTWEGGLKHLVKLKGQLTELDFGNSIIEPADVERLRKEMPDTKIIWGGINAGREELKKAWIRPRAEKWIPKELLARAMAEDAK